MNDALKARIRRLLHRVVDEYRVNWVYATDTPPDAAADGETVEPENAAHRAALRGSTTHKMRNSQSFADAGFAGLVLVRNDLPVSVAHFAEYDQYHHHSIWPLHAGEVAVMDLATAEEWRGHGLAPQLLRAATRRYLADGRRRMIAFIWWSNTPSLRTFRKAGWRRIGFSVELRRGRHRFKIHIPVP